MKNRKFNMRYPIKGMVLAMLMMVCLSGCGNTIPNMTAEEEQEIGEYAAMMLLRYDANNRSRLVDLSAVENLKPVQTPSPEIDNTEGGVSNQENMIPPTTENTPVVDNTGNAGLQNAGNLENFYGLPEGVEMAYSGMLICDSYPQNENDYFIIEASNGNKLLVLKFLIQNQSQIAQNIDLLSADGIYKVSVNNGEAKNAAMTMLMNDMSTYLGTVDAGQSEEVVLIVEVKEAVAADIRNISLSIKNEANVCTITDLK